MNISFLSVCNLDYDLWAWVSHQDDSAMTFPTPEVPGPGEVSSHDLVPLLELLYSWPTDLTKLVLESFLWESLEGAAFLYFDRLGPSFFKQDPIPHTSSAFE